MIEWKPIDTAEKDGKDILVYACIATVDVVHIAYWSDGEFWEDQGFSNQDEAMGWWSYTRGSVSQDKLDEWRTPTHWAPYNPPSGVVR